MNNICVFCGSSHGNDPIYDTQAKTLGKLLAENNKALVYGGGNIGLMGVIADAVMDNGGKVVGIIPDFLMRKEVGHLGLSELIVVRSMHERKQKMTELADGFVAMPGGFGTLEELGEILTWVQLGLIKKPVALLNVNGFYNNLLLQMDHMVKQGFLKPQNRKLIINLNNAEDVLPLLESHIHDDYSIWDDLDKT
ncbi:TIGR00730 family Rossman fold protein [Fulvivirga sp. 29W222]|uniref:Cytokinin riboside 5'-monophosphate phosphoribohydrolase n=1 Tax=Fulvivirga marina TaxID=2494733 RepID=A0A937KBM9_9BACT|nr:TIGR00730 family Rossman fold protein [Fulvivirga marina]MBL6446284.1 TIGR00730 family Rossman fold protein [Fulvivirga marina]